MTIRSDLSINWVTSPRIITVAAPSTEVTMQDLVDTVRDLEDELNDGLQYEYILDAAGKENLGGGVAVGVTVTLRNARLAFEARAGLTFDQCNISGGNLVAVDADGDSMEAVQTTSYTQVIRTSSSSATLLELSAIQYSSYDGGVTVDVTTTFSGIDFPVGTIEAPVNNMVDALSIAQTRGFRRFYVKGNLTLSTVDVSGGYIFMGESDHITTIIINPGANVTNCVFRSATVTGTLDGNNTIENGLISTLTYVEGHIHNCLLDNVVITLGGTEDSHFLNCWSGVIGMNQPIVDMGGSGKSLGIRGYSGGIRIRNKNGVGDNASIDLISGSVTLDSTVTAGDIVIRGVGVLVDNSVGATVHTEGFVNVQNIIDGTWSDAEAKKLLTTGKFLALK